MFVSGSAEIYEAAFAFDASWDGFARTAVFECGGERREQLLVGDRCIVPWEILHAGAYLRVGVYGVSGDATMPTVYSGTMFVARGAEPSEAAREHSADMFDQIVEIGQQAAEAKEQWENMSAEAQTLPAGTPATASYSGGVLSLGIPAGAGGEGGASDLSLGITGATQGQIAKITAVDENGTPTAWAPVDMPSGGGGAESDPTVPAWAKVKMTGSVGQLITVSAVDEGGIVKAVEPVTIPNAEEASF